QPAAGPGRRAQRRGGPAAGCPSRLRAWTRRAVCGGPQRPPAVAPWSCASPSPGDRIHLVVYGGPEASPTFFNGGQRLTGIRRFPVPTGPPSTSPNELRPIESQAGSCPSGEKGKNDEHLRE